MHGESNELVDGNELTDDALSPRSAGECMQTAMTADSP